MEPTINNLIQEINQKQYDLNQKLLHVASALSGEAVPGTKLDCESEGLVHKLGLARNQISFGHEIIDRVIDLLGFTGIKDEGARKTVENIDKFARGRDGKFATKR